jgi:hypothetical protein
MKIKPASNTVYTFGALKQGELFRYGTDHTIYMKIIETKANNYLRNTIDISNGLAYQTNDTEKVFPVLGSFVEE